ncbi:MAG: immunoglobulin domain-containing protein [Phycisphaerales bacterium]
MRCFVPTAISCAAVLALVSGRAFAQPVLITTSQTITPGQVTITPTGGGAAVPLATAQITVSGGGTVLTINGAHSIASLTVQSSARVTHDAGFTYDADPGPGVQMVGGCALTTTGNVTIDSGTSIDVTGRGYAGGQGPGAGGNTPTAACGGRGGSGGYGGSGGAGSGSGNPFGGGTYGSFTQPTDLGSGGGSNGTAAGVRGGGAVRLVVGGALTINGSVLSNGEQSGNGAGSGSGGSIWIAATTLSGTGAIRADGITNPCSGSEGSGGGRVALFCNRTGFSGTISAEPGAGGGPGSQYLDGLPAAQPQLIYSGNGSNALSTPLIVGAGVDVFLQNGANLSHAGGNTNGLTIDIAGNLTIETGSGIDVSSRGFAGGQGPGAGGNTTTMPCGGRGGSGGYGGSGSAGSGAGSPTGGGTYGSFAAPIDLGSGGGSNGSTPGARGGGAARVIVGGTLTLNGTIQANGEQNGNGGGSGSGGSIWITASTLNGTGNIRANGIVNPCSGTEGSGGGRVAVYGNRTGFSGSISATPGNGGGPGSQYLDGLPAARPKLIYSGSGFNALSDPLVVGSGIDVFLRNGASLTHAAGNVNGLRVEVAGNLTIESGSAIDASARGYGSGQGPGAGGSTPSNPCGGRGGAGGHGASGAAGSGTGSPTGGGTYGSFAQPIDLGSGGGSNGAAAGARGGGAVRVIVGGTLTLNGTIQANGEQNGNGSGSGSGGSIWITAPTISGAGAIRADGIANPCSGAEGSGGGRVAVYGSRTGFSGTIQSLGGNGSGPGSVYLEGAPTTSAQLIYSGSGLNSLSQPLVVGSGVDVFLRNGAGLTHAAGEVNGLLLDIAGNLTIDSGCLIDVSARGYAGGQGPGAGGSTTTQPCSGRGGAGGYGGSGSAGSGAGSPSGGGTYGSSTQPSALGSGGGSNGAESGAKGGGATRLIVGGTLTINGNILANGGQSANGAGSGSGGSIWITAPTINGTGAIRANGISNPCVGGESSGGGRVAVYSCFNNLTGAIAAAAGTGGQNGTVVNDTIAGNVAAVASAFCTGDDATLAVQAGGVGTITYQWRRNGVNVSNGTQPSGAVYAGATSPTLTITDVTQFEQGSYDVAVTASCASIVSNAVPVDVVGASPFPCDNIDFNNDCSAFDPTDIDAFLSVYSEGPCIPDTATCNDIDFNNDTSIFDPQDIDAYLSVYSEGPCL